MPYHRSIKVLFLPYLSFETKKSFLVAGGRKVTLVSVCVNFLKLLDTQTQKWTQSLTIESLEKWNNTYDLSSLQTLPYFELPISLNLSTNFLYLDLFIFCTFASVCNKTPTPCFTSSPYMCDKKSRRWRINRNSPLFSFSSLNICLSISTKRRIL